MKILQPQSLEASSDALLRKNRSVFLSIVVIQFTVVGCLVAYAVHRSTEVAHADNTIFFLVAFLISTSMVPLLMMTGKITQILKKRAGTLEE
jgi:hypothetical protein